MPVISSVIEYRFVDPRTIVEGRDERGYLVLSLIDAHGGFVGQPIPKLVGGPMGALSLRRMYEEMAVRQAEAALAFENEMALGGHLARCDRSPGCRCAFIAEDARNATRTGERTHLARIDIPL